MSYKHLKRNITIIIFVFVIIILTFVCTNEVCDVITNSKISSFVNRGTLEKTENNIEYYKVSKKYDYEDTTSRIIDEASDNIGTTGDIYIISTDWGDSFITKYICENLRVGHAGIVYDKLATYTYEVVGNRKKSENIVNEYVNDWKDVHNYKELIILRVKGIDNNDRDKIKNHLDEIKGSKYNYFPFIHLKNRYYCTDLVTRTYKDALNININEFFISTGSSMINNDNTYIVYYKKEIKKGDIKARIYYLGD